MSLFGGYSRTQDFVLPWETGHKYGGVGGTAFFDDMPHKLHTPIVFVHGNTRDATDWVPVMQYLRDRGYTGDSLWAITFARRTPSHAEMSVQLDDFVANVREHLGVDKVNIVAHSLGVTGVRYWLSECDRYEWVDSFVGIAGANHGVAAAALAERYGLTFGKGRPAMFLNPERLDNSEHPLAKLNEDETPGGVRYYTIRATDDAFFRENSESPMLDGAEVNLEVESTHDGVRVHPETLEALYRWLSD